MEEKSILTFRDEDGQPMDFELADSFEYNGQSYVALIPPAEEDEYESEVIIMRIETEETGEDVLVYIESDDELDAAFAVFKDRTQDEYDFLD